MDPLDLKKRLAWFQEVGRETRGGGESNPRRMRPDDDDDSTSLYSHRTYEIKVAQRFSNRLNDDVARMLWRVHPDVLRRFVAIADGDPRRQEKEDPEEAVTTTMAAFALAIELGVGKAWFDAFDAFVKMDPTLWCHVIRRKEEDEEESPATRSARFHAETLMAPHLAPLAIGAPTPMTCSMCCLTADPTTSKTTYLKLNAAEPRMTM